MKVVFQDPTFSSQLLRTIGATYYKGADIGECLSTAYRIKEGDFESWYTEWLKTAKRVHKYADDCLAGNHKVSAREAYLRASNYYRAAEFLLISPEDPRIQTTWGSSKECFSNAGKLFSPPIESIEIPYEGTTLPGHFYRLNENSNNDTATPPPRPTLIAHGGFDSTLEELYTFAAAPALERGYNCLTFEGPGQGGVIRKQKIPFRYDWEKVVTPVIDYALTKDRDIDPNNIALMGISMGAIWQRGLLRLNIEFLQAFCIMGYMMAMTHLVQVSLNHYEQLLKMVIQMPSTQLLIFYQTSMQI